MSAVRPVVNLDELAFDRVRQHGDAFASRAADVAGRIGAKKLGYSVVRVEPGKRFCPFHSHHVNEEMFFVLEGRGTLRFGSEQYPVRPGDFIACPPGDAEVAHQLIAADDTELVYLALGTRSEADVWSYPDSGKFGVVAGVTRPNPSGPPTSTFAPVYHRDGTGLDYWDGE